ncbi:hypothetical protein COL26b_004298 [Colletotrichum chrysophilum]|uniref:Uncharacterized protein n=1 Tax=Colletotrichum chrysophilum TaxID=1836956 RepID=A0AAD9A9F4_9PEZI|nr:uncharacterized protein COL26b_004298 [Colletotrichum chrysophilum]KAJ0377348.1 hypothetical protein COL26b_004298 [Colletotrichum chrysophilum]KAK1842542.1 hypothetical protein CCHR01_14840 [Colletotrichum chrysophilum]
MASSKDSGLGQLGAMFELRFKHICTMHSKGETEAAETKALELLAEPRLGRLHKAGMHMILATSETDFRPGRGSKKIRNREAREGKGPVLVEIE